MAPLTELVGYLVLFTVVAVVFLLSTLLIGKLVRPNLPNPEKKAIYECGEPTIGSSWVQFDLRFYVVALLFVIFDVEVAFFFPWAVVFGKTTRMADYTVARTEQAHASDVQAFLDAAPSTSAVEPVKGPLADLGLPALPATNKELLDTHAAASTLAMIAFLDLLVFFGVVLVGFAYLWKRGDLDWVRATASEGDASAERTWAEPPKEREEPVAQEIG